MPLSIFSIYEGNYKRCIAIPAALFIACLCAVLVYPGITTGIDLQGGTLIIVRADTEMNQDTAKQVLAEKFDLRDLTAAGISSPAGYGLTIQYAYNPVIEDAAAEITVAESLLSTSPDDAKQHAVSALSLLSRYAKTPDQSALTPEQALDAAQLALIDSEEAFNIELEQAIRSTFSLPETARFQKREVGATLGETFWENSKLVAITSLVLVVLVVFLFFREFIPSLAVISAAVFDIAAALALMAVFGLPLSLATISALLMLVGYSVDTDIMLTTRLLKRKEHTPRERTVDAMKTGLTMTFTTLAAVSVMFALSYLTQMVVIFEISGVMLFGLLADVVSTWLMNAPVLLWYVERKRGAAA